jgi:pyruvate carboxylase
LPQTPSLLSRPVLFRCRRRSNFSSHLFIYFSRFALNSFLFVKTFAKKREISENGEKKTCEMRKMAHKASKNALTGRKNRKEAQNPRKALNVVSTAWRQIFPSPVDKIRRLKCQTGMIFNFDVETFDVILPPKICSTS